MDDPARKPTERIEAREFLERLFPDGDASACVEARILPAGEARTTGWFSKKPYILVEEDVSWTDADGCEMSLTPRFSEERFLLASDGVETELDFRDVRLALAPCYEASYAKPDAAPEPVGDCFADRGAKTVTVREYGIPPGATVFCSLRIESYALPPRKPSPEPEYRERKLILLSLAPLDAAARKDLLTPGYRRWSY